MTELHEAFELWVEAERECAPVAFGAISRDGSASARMSAAAALGLLATTACRVAFR